MKKIKFILQYTKPEGHKILLEFLCVFLYAFGLLLAPLLISFMLDNIINDLPLENVITTFLVNMFGGIETFKKYMWMGPLLIIIIYILVAFGTYKKGVYAGIVSETFAKNIRDALYDHLQKLPFAYHKVKDSGDLIQRCTSDIDQIRRFLAAQIVEMMYAIIMAISAIMILCMINVKLTILSFITLPILILSSYYFFKKSKRIFWECDFAESKLTTTLQENLNAVRVVKAFNQENEEINKFKVVNEAYRDRIYELMHALAIFWSCTDCVSLIQIFLMIIFGIDMAYEGSLTAGEFFVFLTYVSSAVWPLRQLGRIIADMGKLSVAIDRINEVLHEEKEDLESGLKPEIKGNIIFSDVSFSYEDSDDQKHTLKHLNLEIHAKESIAIMGATGSGKSSLVNLLTRLYDYEGSIKIDGVELNTIAKKWLRSHVNIVLQEPFLFSKSIYNNIALAKSNATYNDVVKASKIAAIHDVIEEFDEGYETEVGEKGVTLSGGQKQRIAIARTIINEAPIVIFDDSLSALDTKTDALIQKQLALMSKDITMIMITHRISSAKQADRIIVLDNGQIAQMGTHDELIKQEGIYKRIYEIQNEGGECNE